MTSSPTRLAGKTVLVVEDDFLIAQEMRRGLESKGLIVLSPAPSLDRARGLLRAHATPVHGALLDLRLKDESGLYLVDELIAEGVQVVLVTGYDRGSIPARYAGVTLCEKPMALETVIAALFPEATPPPTTVTPGPACASEPPPAGRHGAPAVGSARPARGLRDRRCGRD